jgi:hypothetical protein
MEIGISLSHKHKIIGNASLQSHQEYQRFVMHEMEFLGDMDVYPALYKKM